VANLVSELEKKHLISPPGWLANSVHYLTIMGSAAYGVSRDASDLDTYGFCIPPKEIIFPHLAGEIPGFGTPKKRFNQWQQHHVQDPTALAGKGREYDLTVYNVVDYFDLLMKNNPNMVDSIFTHETCVLHVTRIGSMVRERRKLFLHKGCWPTFKGYAYAQMKKIRSKERHSSARRELIEKYGFDVKYSYHLVRLLGEVEQILTEGDLDLMRNREQLKAIRNGEWTEQQLEDYFARKEASLEEVYNKSTLRPMPDEAAIKELLLNVLEEHYGSLDRCVVRQDAVVAALRKVISAAEDARRVLESGDQVVETRDE
jgi:predicted nucleotidyltransferase